jgi:hypothetical protein
MEQPNTVFLHMFDWFIMKLGVPGLKITRQIGREWQPHLTFL